MDLNEMTQKLFTDRVAAYVQANAGTNAGAFPGAHVAAQWLQECRTLAEAYFKAL